MNILKDGRIFTVHLSLDVLLRQELVFDTLSVIIAQSTYGKQGTEVSTQTHNLCVCTVQVFLYCLSEEKNIVFRKLYSFW